METVSMKKLERWHDEDKYQKIVDAVMAMPESARTFEHISHQARAYTNLGKYQDAYNLLCARRSEGNENALWNWRIGLCLYKTGKQAEAISYLEKAIELGDDHNETKHYLNLALAYAPFNQEKIKALTASLGASEYNIVELNIHFTLPFDMINSGTLKVCLEMEESDDIQKYSLEHMQKILSRFSEWDTSGRALIKQEHPEEDENQPELNDLIVKPDGSFKVGFDAGEAEEGQLFLYVCFSSTFEVEMELEYELY